MAEKEMKAIITADDSDFKRKADRTAKKGNWLSGQFKKIGGAIAAAMAGAFAFGAIINGIKSVIKNTAAFEKSLASLSAITGATGDELKFYGREARKMAKETSFGASEVVEAFKLMGSARPELLKNKEALAAVTKEALILAEASGLDLTTATESLAKAMNQFNIPAAEAGRVINVLAAGSKEGAAEVPAVADAIKSMGTAAKMANISLEQSVAMIEALAEKGLSGAESGTMLRNVILMLQNGVDKFNPKVVGMSTALENLAAENLSASELTQMFGLRNQQAAAILIETRGRVDELTAAVTGTNTAYEQHAVVQDTLSSQWKIFKGVLQDLTIGSDRFTTSLKNMLKTLSDGMKRTMDSMKLDPDSMASEGIDKLRQSLSGLDEEARKAKVSEYLADLRNKQNELSKAALDADNKYKELSKTLSYNSVTLSNAAIAADTLQEEYESVTLQIKSLLENSNDLIGVQEELTETIIDGKGALSEYNKELEKAPPLPTESVDEFTKRLWKQYEAQQALEEANLRAIDNLFGLDEAYAIINETIAGFDEGMVNNATHLDLMSDKLMLLTDLAYAFSDAVVGAAVQGEMGLKDYSRTVANTARTNIKAYMAESIAAAIKNNIGIGGPFGIILAGVAAGAAAALFNQVVPAFAQGGAVSGPTLALVGEGAGVSRSNPEYIGTAAQLGQMGGGGGGTARFLRISRGDLLFAVNESTSHSKRSF